MHIYHLFKMKTEKGYLKQVGTLTEQTSRTPQVPSLLLPLSG